MRYFSGFSLKNEQELFLEYLIKNEFAVGGFSYGAIKAFEYVLNSKKRIDTLQLFSPANFSDKDEKFRKLQLIHYRKNQKLYTENFLKNITNPSTLDMSKYLTTSCVEELKELLNYNWSERKLDILQKKGVKIEVYLGEKDKITDSQTNYDFFKKFATVYYIKNVGHILN